MQLPTSERMQELMVIAYDRFGALNKKWWYLLAVTAVVSIPLFFVLKFSLAQLFISSYTPPVVFTDRPQAQELQLVDTKIFDLNDGNYAGLVRIRNINLDRGVPELFYTATFKTFSGETATVIEGKTFVLPASEKILAFVKFSSQVKPEVVDFAFRTPRFVFRPQVPAVNLEVQRVRLERGAGEFFVSAGVRNTTPFTIKQIYLPVLLYDTANNLVGVNATTINQVKSSEVRTFRYIWAADVQRAVRAEITPEVDIFDRNVFVAETGNVQLFLDQTKSEQP